MKVETLTVAQLTQICLNNKYIIVRDQWNDTAGINCGIVNVIKMRGNPKNKTQWYSYKPCSFHEYISNKIKFI